MKTIGIVIPYFGKLPETYKVWEITALNNPTIDFWIFTDCDINERDNIHVVKMSFLELKNLFESMFDFTIVLDNPYKLCDYKPVYGKVFNKWICKYDFWGYCDIDLLFGNIRTFFTDEILESYDRCGYSGHISIYKNCEKMNNLYTYYENDGKYPALNFKKVFTSNEAWYFDEARGMYTKCLLNRIPVYTNYEIRDPMEGETYFYWGGE